MNSNEELARSVAERLRKEGFQAYFVGGCVRDRLLGIPAKDFDIATDAHPCQVTKLFPGSVEVGLQFGVVLIRKGEASVEIATFRQERGYSDGRHPSVVEFGTDAKTDAERRDFTINALFEDPMDGKVLDFTGGQADLAAGVVRAIGDPEVRFREDHLRMLRAIRFAARFDFRIEPETFAAIERLAPLIERVAKERVRDELSRILTEGGARRGLELLDRSGLLPRLLPEVSRMKGVEQPPEFHPEGDVWVHTMLMLGGLGKAPLPLAWGVLLHDVGKPPTFRIADRIRFDGHVEAGVAIAETILKRLHYPNELIEEVKQLVAQHMKFKDAPRMRESTLKRFLRQEHFDRHLELHRLDCVSSHGGLDSYELVKQRLKQYSAEAEPLNPVPLVSGKDLIELGYEPGPQFREMLQAVEDAQLEKRITTREEGLDLVRRTFGSAEAGQPGPTAGPGTEGATT